MEHISRMVTHNHHQQLEEILCRMKGSSDYLHLQTKEFEELFVYASFLGNVACLRVLLQCVIDVNFSACLKNTLQGLPVSPLRVAVEYDNTDAVKWLCCQGADVNSREAVWSTKIDDVISGMFITRSCPVPCMTALHFARSSASARILLEHGADLSAQDCMGKTPVAMAILDGRLDVLETLCNHGAPLNLASNWGATPLMYAQYGRSKEERVSATEILCRAGADGNLQDRNGRSALHIAKDVECVCMILTNHGDPSIETIFGKTPLVTCAEEHRWDICRVLLAAEAAPSLGALGRGSSLFCSLTREDRKWLIKRSMEVRDLTHLCRCAIRNQLKMKSESFSEGISRLPLPAAYKHYLSFQAN